MIGAWSAFHYQGQTCITAGRHIVAARRRRCLRRGPGRPGRGHHRRQHRHRGGRARPDDQLPPAGPGQALLDEAVAEGAKVVAGGSTDGPFFRPTVVTGVSRESRLWTEEIFAPIAPVLVVDGDDEAVEVANDTPYGLVDSVLTGDPYRGIQVARRLRAGMVHVNDATPQDEALAPFGGVGQSGLGGRSGGDSNIEEFTERRWLTVNPGPAHYPY